MFGAPFLSAAIIVPLWPLLRFLYRTFLAWRFSPLRRSVPVVDPPSLFLGHQGQIIAEPFMAPHRRWWEAVGMDKKMVLYYTVGMRESLLLVHPDAARVLLKARASPKRGTGTAAGGRKGGGGGGGDYIPKNLPVLRRYIGNGLVTLNGSEWHRHRTIAQPAFATHFVRTVLETAVPPLAEDLCRAWEALPRGTPVLLHDHLMSVTLDAIGRAGFGHDFGSTEELVRWAGRVREMAREDGGGAGTGGGGGSSLRFERLPPREVQTNPLATAFSPAGLRVVRPTFAELAFGPLYTALASRLLPRSLPWRRAEVSRSVDAVIEEIIREQRERCRRSEDELTKAIRRRSSNLSDSGEADDGRREAEKVGRSVRRTPRSILELLVSQFSGLADAELRDEVKTFLFAGAETTSTAANLTLFALCSHPRGDDIQGRLHDEASRLWPDASAPVTAEAVQGMEYLHAVLHEGLRLYPPVGMLVRDADAAVPDLAGATVPRGTRLVLSILLLHRNPAVWGPRAEEFVPERWMADPAERAAAPGGGVDGVPDDPFAFLPFSAGGRQCIGKGFAVLEAKMILATIIRRFRVKVAKEQRGAKYVMESFITTRTKPKFLVEVEPRKD